MDNFLTLPCGKSPSATQWNWGMKARGLFTGFRTVLLLDVFLENIQRDASTRVYKIRARPKDGFSVEPVDMVGKLFTNQSARCCLENFDEFRDVVVWSQID